MIVNVLKLNLFPLVRAKAARIWAVFLQYKKSGPVCDPISLKASRKVNTLIPGSGYFPLMNDVDFDASFCDRKFKLIVWQIVERQRNNIYQFLAGS